VKTNLNGLHAGILRNILVLIEAILGSLTLPQANTQLDEKDHDRLKGGNRGIAGAL
jgi:hypothetical protein